MKTKTTPQLHAIESKLSRLWTNREERARYLDEAANRPSIAAESEGGEKDFVGEIDAAGVKLYGSLIEIGRIDLMASIYPMIESLVGKQFRNLVFDYYDAMPPVHYNLNQAASRFYKYVAGVEKLMGRYPFISELADYEWIELAVLEDPAMDIKYEVSGAALDAESFAGTMPVLNSVFVARRYRYNIPALVQAIKDGEKLPRRFKQDPSCVVVYRDPDTLEARFLEVGEVSLTMLELIKENPSITYGELIKEICSRNESNMQGLLSGCLEAIEQFKELKIIVAEKCADAPKEPKKAARKSGRA